MTGRCLVEIEFDQLDSTKTTNEIAGEIENKIKELFNVEYAEIIDIDTYLEQGEPGWDEQGGIFKLCPQKKSLTDLHVIQIMYIDLLLKNLVVTVGIKYTEVF